MNTSVRNPRLRAFVRRQALLSIAINAGFSVVFFLLIFGLPGRILAWEAPDRLALDFLPQMAMVGLMSALVPVLAGRRTLAELIGRPMLPLRGVVLEALGWCGLSLAFGAGLAALSWLWPGATIGGWAALLLKATTGGVFGAVVTKLALGRAV